MNRNTARAIERHRLACIPLRDGSWMIGDSPKGITIDMVQAGLYGTISDNPVTGRPHVGESLDSAVEDWCNARNLRYERED